MWCFWLFLMDKLLEGDLKENVKIYNLKCSAIHASK